MYLMVKEMVVPISDLRYVSVDCSICKTDVTLDMLYKPAPSTDTLIPTPTTKFTQCPMCRSVFDTRLTENIAAFRTLYQDLVRHKLKISFRVKGESGVEAEA